MKLLLDENLPQLLRLEIKGHDVFTTGYMGWSGVENGALLKIASDAGFDALITNDRGLEYEQDLENLPLAVVVLLAKANTISALHPLLIELDHVLSDLPPKTLVKVPA